VHSTHLKGLSHPFTLRGVRSARLEGLSHPFALRSVRSTRLEGLSHPFALRSVHSTHLEGLSHPFALRSVRSTRLEGLFNYTATRLPVKLMYSAQFPSRLEALQAEKKIQGWRRKKKEALISGDWEKLSYLARRNKK
jgi:predicted GIY-YIG superfamily endonuclease